MTKVRNCTTAFGFNFGALVVERMYHTNGYTAVRIRTEYDDGVIIEGSPHGRQITVNRLPKRRPKRKRE